MTLDWKRVGKRIEARMRELSMTKAEIQRLASVSDKTLNGYIAGEPIVRGDKARGLCNALGWSPDSIDRIAKGGEPIVVRNGSGLDARLSQLEDHARSVDQRLDEILRRLGEEQ